MQYEVVERDKISESPPRLSRPSPPPSVVIVVVIVVVPPLHIDENPSNTPSPPPPLSPSTPRKATYVYLANADRVAGVGLSFFFFYSFLEKRVGKEKVKNKLTKIIFCLNSFPVYYFIPPN